MYRKANQNEQKRNERTNTSLHTAKAQRHGTSACRAWRGHCRRISQQQQQEKRRSFSYATQPQPQRPQRKTRPKRRARINRLKSVKNDTSTKLNKLVWNKGKPVCSGMGSWWSWRIERPKVSGSIVHCVIGGPRRRRPECEWILDGLDQDGPWDAKRWRRRHGSEANRLEAARL